MRTVERSSVRGWLWLPLIVGLLGGGPAAATAAYVFTTLDVPGALTTAAYGINDAGQIVGGFFDATDTGHGFLYTGGAFTTIDGPGASGTAATGINNAGQILGGFGDATSEHIFVNTGGVFTTIDFPPGTSGAALGINAAGEIVGAFNSPIGTGF